MLSSNVRKLTKYVIYVFKVQILFFYIYDGAAIKPNQSAARLHKILNYAA